MKDQNQPVLRAKPWQLAFFGLLVGGSNAFMLTMNFSSYIANGLYGIATVTLSLLLTCTRIFDAVTDPICGFVMDHLNTHFGRFRPLIVIGYLIMVVSTLAMFFVGKGGIVGFTLLYVVYIIGYTIITSVSRAAVPILTNDSRQRPIIGRFSAFSTVILSTFTSTYLSKVLAPKYGGINPAALQEMLITAIIMCGIFALCAVIALCENDKPENVEKLAKNAQPKLRDCWSTIKDNRNIQMLIVAGATDKLAQQIGGNSTLRIMIYGILIANYSFSGNMSLYAFIPSVLGIVFITKWARSKGCRPALYGFSWAGIAISAITILFFLIVDPTQISVAAVPTAIFVVLDVLRSLIVQSNSAMTSSMVADCSDYETYRTGKFMPGMVSTVYSFVDKLVSSLSTTIVGLACAAIGFKDALPAIGDPATPALLWVAILLAYGAPMLGWIASVIALKFYDLTPEKMDEIHKYNAELRAKNAQAG